MMFPGISDEDNSEIADDKEARFRKLAGEPWQEIASEVTNHIACRNIQSRPETWPNPQLIWTACLQRRTG